MNGGLEMDDLVEPFYRHLRCCYDRLDQHARALQYYERCRQLLHNHFGIPPFQDTEVLHRELLTAERK